MDIKIITGEFKAFYSILGPFSPPRVRPFIPYAERVAYAETGKARHRASVRRSPGKWALSRLREIGDGLIGAFFITAD